MWKSSESFTYVHFTSRVLRGEHGLFEFKTYGGFYVIFLTFFVAYIAIKKPYSPVINFQATLLKRYNCLVALLDS